MLLVLNLACSGSNSDTASGPTGGVIPDVASRYNAIITGISGCEGDSSWVEPWASGPMEITGSGSSLTYDFDDDMAFSGSVGTNGSAIFAGSGTWNEADLVLDFTGIFSVDEVSDDTERWLLEGDFSITVDDDDLSDNDCTMDAGLEAYEMVGL